MNGPAEGFDKAAIAARGPVSGITIHAHMRSGPHAIVDYPIDLVVVTELSFQLAERARTAPGEHPPAVTPQSLLGRLREMGVRSGNGSRLIGRDAVYESFARLRAKGYLRRIVHRVDNKVSGVSYEYYEFPAWNPEPPTLEADTSSPQVGAASGNAGSGYAGTRSENRTSCSSSQVKSASGNAGSGNAGSRSPGKASPQVGAASGNAGSPPHPPEGGGNTTPKPPKTGRAPKADRLAEACALHPDDHQPTAEDIKAADAFLQDLPGKWGMSIDEARPLAPLLASRVHMLDLDLDTLLELELVQDDPKDPVRRPASVMPTRIRGLKRRRAERKADQGSGGLAPWCGECNGGERPAMVYQRMVELPDGRDVPCQQCHPKHVRTSA